MDRHLANYVIRFYGHFMTEKEKSTQRHLFGTAKSTHGRTDSTPQEEARRARPQLRVLFSDDPEVLELTHGGIESFVQRTAERIMAAHKDEIYVNRCPRCGEVAKTPKARQCRFCKNDWHSPQ